MTRSSPEPAGLWHTIFRLLCAMIGALALLKLLFDLLVDLRHGDLWVLHMLIGTMPAAFLVLQFLVDIAAGLVAYMVVGSSARRRAAARLGVKPRIILGGLAGLWLLLVCIPAYVWSQDLYPIQDPLHSSVLAAVVGLAAGVLLRK